MAWQELKLTGTLLREKGFSVLSVWSPSQNLTPSVVYVRWQHVPDISEKTKAEYWVMAPDIRHLTPTETPKGAPWA
ncbi:hypothetical protein [Roseobacter sp. OBYS 0001]|uniref:hypothetical protein n=1 Tax=Roseobacter sp. OBYS 0001 TaxID=882651 RepID=UPI001BBDA0DD|nr:hypothetical protein [Roseobacter sp. OBYS 0001]GIT86167.1 hypothetical protein ROBYS_11830 [Roseobacter sp. OBYS 0001]